MNVVVTLLLISTAASSTVPLKCQQTARMPGFVENEPVVLLDGLLIRGEPGQKLQEVVAGRVVIDPLAGTDAGTDDIYSIELACWRPGDDAFSAGPGIPLVRIHTKSALARTRASVEALVAAQKAMHEASGRHARSAEELFVHGLHRDAHVTYSASDLAWNAVAPAEPGPFRCSVSFLTIEAGSREPEITCEKDAALGIASLQELYDRGRAESPGRRIG